MGYQFIHLEGYARKADAKGRDTNFIFGEASRRPEASVHVASPAPPIIVHGLSIEEVQELHDSAVASATVAVKGGKTRRLRSDQKTLHTVVASHPYTMDEIRADPDKRREAEAWEKRTVEWLRHQYGDDLQSVIRHEDESHYHIHAYVVAISDPELKAQKHHPGATAKRSVMDAGPTEGEDQKALLKRANAAYTATMRAWQDSYHEAVAVPSGLTRLGPQRRRLSRDEWQREQAQAKSLQKAVHRAKAVKASGEEFISRTKADAAKITADAAREQDAARKATAAANAAQDRARQERENAKAAIADVAKYTGWVGRIRAIWDRFHESKMAGRIRNEFLDEINRWRDRAKDAERRQLEAERQRYEAEQQTRAAQDAALRAGIERDRLRSLLLPVADQSTPDLSPAPKLVLKPNFAKKEKRDA